VTQISILSGTRSTPDGQVLDALPINLEPNLISTSVSEGYLTSLPGITAFSASELGRDRGAINWNGLLYRVQGSKPNLC
jgi:hypothetical protein